MRSLLIYMILSLVFGSQYLMAQCDFITPPAEKKINYASREVTFSDVTMNGRKTTYLSVKKGEKIEISTNVESKKKGDYCPDCIVQIYWGIRGYASTCAKSFHSYQFNKKKSKLKFNAPLQEGIYYVTMGATLDYSCKNNVNRPNCSADYAFAVIKVGNPDPEKKIELVKVKRGNMDFLKATLIKPGCFVNLDKTEWFLDGKKLAYDNQETIPLTQTGTYKVVWSNCLANATMTYEHAQNSDKKVVSLSLKEDLPDPVGVDDKKRILLTVNNKPREEEVKEKKVIFTVSPTEGASSTDDEDIETLIENNDKFVIKSLIFDLGKYDIKPEAKKDLDKLAQIMRNNSSMKILLEGHTDVRGGARKNQKLSEQRVESAKIYLVQKGVNERNIDTIGWGHQKPLVITNNIEEGKINRRVEVQILSR